MPTSSIFTNVKITDPEKAEAFINALDEAANNTPVRKERTESHILTNHEEIRKLMERGLKDVTNGKEDVGEKKKRAMKGK